MRITNWRCGFEREPLLHPFGFKGGYLSELWQVAVVLNDADGYTGLGTGVQSVLWSDATVFARRREAGGNSLMLAITHFALEQAVGQDWSHPYELQSRLLPALVDYADKVCPGGTPRLTFVLNALVPIDLAAWQLYAAQNGIHNFDDLYPAALRPALSAHHERLAAVPLITYSTSVDEVRRLAESGCALFKIKIGADPDQDGDPAKMLAWDTARLTELHRELSTYSTFDTCSGRVSYYLDANGRYDHPDRVLALLDHACRLGALEQIALLEEPFAEEAGFEVGDWPVCVVADESAHSLEDVRRRLDQGYRGFALKPVAKTLSLSLQTLELAHRHHADCFCADLTVPPFLLEWNRNVAARLAPIKALRIGLLESNGAQNYAQWPRLINAHACSDGAWVTPRQGGFDLDQRFYATSGGVLESSPYYRQLAGVSN
jgi:L-alanine-DL-glutamate epimerase-like enolase superfamily enzyme